MNIKICKNISKYRKENNVTQAQIAEYLGVSPQAVSKWEQEATMPDVFLIPKIAFFFNISIDTLFGTSNIDTAKLLVSKYSMIRNDKNYKDAKEAVDILLEMNDEDIAALSLLYEVEQNRIQDYLCKCKNINEKLLNCSRDNNAEWTRRSSLEKIRMESQLGSSGYTSKYIKIFEETKSEENFNYLLCALNQRYQYEEVIRWGRQYLGSYSHEAIGSIYPLLMEAALELNDLKFAEICLIEVLENNEDSIQIFSMWWVMLKLYKKNKMLDDIEKCKIVLLDLLPSQGCNEYTYEYYLKAING